MLKNYILYDGYNEVGPLTLEQVKTLNISRTTPVRLAESNHWTTPDKIAELRTLVVQQRPIRRAADVIPGVRERVVDLHYRRPNILYGSLLAVGLLTCIGIYSSKKIFDTGRWAAQPVIAGATTEKSAQSNVTLPVEQTMQRDTVAASTKKITTPKTTPSVNWRELITVQKSSYGYGVLGGISNLQLIVTNRSDYLVDEVVAKVTYVKANGKVWKSKIVRVKNVEPHSKKSVDMEDVYRSKKVEVHIQQVRSKAMNLNQEVN